MFWILFLNLNIPSIPSFPWTISVKNEKINKGPNLCFRNILYKSRQYLIDFFKNCSHFLWKAWHKHTILSYSTTSYITFLTPSVNCLYFFYFFNWFLSQPPSTNHEMNNFFYIDWLMLEAKHLAEFSIWFSWLEIVAIYVFG